MKLSDLTPCALCGNPIAPIFYRVTAEQLMINASAANEMLGLTQMFGGALELAEVMGSQPDVTLSLQKNSILVCQDCFIDSELGRRTLFDEDSDEQEAA